MKSCWFFACLTLCGIGACEKSLRPDPHVAAAAEGPPLPAHWTGTGVLSAGTHPAGAPDWVQHTAEVVQRNGLRFLRALGHAEHIDDASVGRSTAENRARAEVSRWLGQHWVRGGMAVNTWQGPAAGTYWVQLEVAVPPDALAAINP